MNVTSIAIVWSILVLLLAALVVSRLLYSFLSSTNGGDSYDHKILISEIRKSGYRIPKEMKYFATSGSYQYPYLLHWVLAVLPIDYDTMERYTSAISDLFLAAIVLSLVPFGYLTTLDSLLGVGIILSMPQFVRPDLSHGRGLSARKPGLLMVSVSLISLVHFSISGQIAWLVIATIFGGLVILTSKFSMQAYVIALLGIATTGELSALAVLILAFVLAILLSAGRYALIFAAHYRHLKNWALSQQFKLDGAGPFNPISVSLEFLQNLIAVRPISEAFDILYDNLIVRVIANSPWIFLAAAYVIWWSADVSIAGASIIAAWLTAMLVAFVVTSFPYVRFLGQPERYLEYAIIPAILIVVPFTTSGPWWGSAAYAVTFSVGIVLIVSYVYYFSRGSFSNPEFSRSIDGVSEALTKRQGDLILAQPRWFGAALAWKSGVRVVEISLHAGSSRELIEELHRLCPIDSMHLTDDVEWLRERYNPDWVVFKKPLEGYPDHSLEPNAAEPVFENEHFVLIPFRNVYEQYN